MEGKYYLRGAWQNTWDEVSKEQFVQAERSAGFRSKFGSLEPATGGFGNGTIDGKIVYGEEDPNATHTAGE